MRRETYQQILLQIRERLFPLSSIQELVEKNPGILVDLTCDPVMLSRFEVTFGKTSPPLLPTSILPEPHFPALNTKRISAAPCDKPCQKLADTLDYTEQDEENDMHSFLFNNKVHAAGR